MSIFTRSKLWLVVLVVVLCLVPVGVVTAQGGNCDGVLNSADNHDVSWSGWDRFINRVQSRGCDYADISVETFVLDNTLPVGAEFQIFVIITNLGNVNADHFVVNAKLPSEVFYFILQTSTEGAIGEDPGDTCNSGFSSNEIICNVATMYPSGRITLTATVEGTVARPATTTVSLTDDPDNGDLDPRNNSDSVTVILD